MSDSARHGPGDQAHPVGPTALLPGHYGPAQVYICGPMRGLPRRNFSAFFAAEDLLAGQGWKVWNPARVDIELDGFNPDTDENALTMPEYMRRDFIAILSCEAVAMLPGWERSEGGRREVSLTIGLALLIIDATTGEPYDFSVYADGVPEPPFTL